MSATLMRLAAATLATAALAGPAGATGTLWAYEGFDYAVGSGLNDADGGSGWAGAWTLAAAGMSIVGGLSYTDAAGRRLDVSGGAADAWGIYGSAQRFTQQDWGAPGSSVWISVLQRNVPVIAGATGAGLSLGVGNEWNGAMYAGIGKTVSGSLRSVVGVNNSSVIASASGSLAPGQTVLHVIRYDFALQGADTVSLWRNPLLGRDPGSADVSASFIDMASLLTGLTLGFNTDGAGNRFVFDELRLGSSFAAVTPFAAAVPEPATLALWGAGLATLAGLARRRAAPGRAQEAA